jgi:hypothetical protein
MCKEIIVLRTTNIDSHTDYKNFIISIILKTKKSKEFFNNVNENIDKDVILNLKIKKYNISYQELKKV